MSTEFQPRTLIFSLRNLRSQASNCCIYEWEDLLCDIEGAQLYSPTSEYHLFRKMYRAARSVSGSDKFARSVTSVPDGMTLDREYDLLFVVVDSPWYLHLVNSIKGWREKCRYAVCWIAETWEPELDKWALKQEPFRSFDHIFLGVSHCVESLQQRVGIPCTYIPPAVNTQRFCPYPNPPERSIDVTYVGRRNLDIHNSLKNLTTQKNFFYYYDTVKGQKLEIDNHQEHRDLFASILQRSRYTMAYYAKFNSTEETGGQQEIGMRFFECTAAGTVILGMPPNNKDFSKYFDWEDAVIKVDPRTIDIADVIAELDSQPEKLAQISRNNVANCLLKHDWTYRWKDILSKVGLQPTEATIKHIDYLHKLSGEIKGEV
ncbi:MAG: glycosyltransferase [Xenococcus sp. MO_188.B8]|nr:glycosyltransferase [Xenococcus sp. MO_188.B8]